MEGGASNAKRNSTRRGHFKLTKRGLHALPFPSFLFHSPPFPSLPKSSLAFPRSSILSSSLSSPFLLSLSLPIFPSRSLLFFSLSLPFTHCPFHTFPFQQFKSLTVSVFFPLASPYPFPMLSFPLIFSPLPSFLPLFNLSALSSASLPCSAFPSLFLALSCFIWQ